MNPIIAQLLIAAIQSLIQAIEAKLSHEERTILVVDPLEFKTDEEVAAYRVVCGKSILLRHIGSSESTAPLIGGIPHVS